MFLPSGPGEDNAQPAVKYAAVPGCYLKPVWHLICILQVAENMSYLVLNISQGHLHNLAFKHTACMQEHPHKHEQFVCVLHLVLHVLAYGSISACKCRQCKPASRHTTRSFPQSQIYSPMLQLGTANSLPYKLLAGSRHTTHLATPLTPSCHPTAPWTPGSP